MIRIAPAALLLAFALIAGVSVHAQRAAPGNAESPRHAVERALPLLQESARTWTRERRCASCHHQGLGPIAMSMAREREFRLDEAMLRAQLGAVRASLASADASVNLPANTNYIDDSLWLAALGAVGDPRGPSSDLVVHRLLSGQHVDGHWIPYPFRPPIEGSGIANTAWAIRALRLFAPSSREKQVDAAIGRARDWIVKQAPLDTQDFAMKLLALRWSGGASDRIVTETARRLVALQRTDGGWSQTSTRESDAYATGQALVALNQAADMRPTDAAFAKGVAFLTRSQHADGSWLVETRRTWRRGIPYAESGFPHGTHQFISYAGAAWATMALVLSDRHEQSAALMGDVAKSATVHSLAAVSEKDAEISGSLTPLMRAALFGSVDDMRAVLKEKPDVNATATKLAVTALMCAAHDAAKVRLLIDAGANVRAATVAGHTALLVAADYAGAVESVRVLLQHGADPSIRTKGFLSTPLARATLHGDRAVVALLLDAGAAINDRPDGSVALLAAANQGDKEMVTLLLDRGANIESHPQATVLITNGEQLPTPLMLAADRGHRDVVTLLLSKGADPNARDRQGMTPLMYAAGAIQTGVNATPVIDALLAAKADVDARAVNGDTALDLADRYSNEPVIAALRAARRPTAPDTSRLSAQDTVPTPRFALRVPHPPTVANGAGGAFLVYELHVTNFVPQQWTLQKVEVLSGTPSPRILQTIEERELGLAITRPGTTIPADQRRVFAGGTWGVVMLWVPVDRDAPPASLSHRVTFVFDNGGSPAARELRGGETTVRRETVTIGAPLRGGPWRAAGFSNSSPHRRALFAYGGESSINARFAIDYVKLGDDDRPFTGERTRNENHHAYGQEALAVADGLVVEIRDGLADNTFSAPLPGGPNLETLVGNHVFLEIAPRVYALYAHLKPGSLRVATGQRVKRGQVIGLVGNTGNSGAPHLHFQLSEDPSIRSEGLAYKHEAFQVVGRCTPTGPTPAEQTCARVPPEIRRDEIPLTGMLVHFHER